MVVNFNRLSTSDDVEIAACEQFSQLGPVAWQLNFQYHQAIQTIFIIIIISLFIQQQNSTNTVTNVDTNEVETGMTRLIALTVTQCTKNIGNMIQVDFTPEDVQTLITLLSAD